MKKLTLLLGIFTALIAILLIVSTRSVAQSGNVEVTISSLKSDQGKCLIYLYKSEEGFPIKPEVAFKKIVNEIKERQSFYQFTDIPFGTYALSVVHDENNNGKLDSNFIGIPKKGIGVSNNVTGSFGPPKFKDAKFDHSKSSSISNITISY